MQPTFKIFLTWQQDQTDLIRLEVSGLQNYVWAGLGASLFRTLWSGYAQSAEKETDADFRCTPSAEEGSNLGNAKTWDVNVDERTHWRS
jgi:hypothetical protein